MLLDISTSMIQLLCFTEQVSTCHLNLVFSVLESLSISLVDSFDMTDALMHAVGSLRVHAAEHHLQCEFVI